MKPATAAHAIQAALVAAALGAWTIATHTQAVSALFLPPPAAVWAGLVKLTTSGELSGALAVTAVEIVQAYTIAAIAGIAAGFFIGRSPRLTAIFEPLLSNVFAIPITLFFPLFILLFGIGPSSKIAFGAVYGFFPIALNTIAAFAGIDRLFLRSARSQGAAGWALFRHVYLPGARPVVITGLRIGFFICFASVLGGETISSAAGIGHAIAHAAELMESGQMYAWIVLVVAISIALNGFVSFVEHRAQRG